jgi:hypothetical protein
MDANDGDKNIPIKVATTITEILLKVALNTITVTL